MIESGLYQYLSQISAVQALAGSRIFGVLMPKESKLPAVVYLTVSTGTIESLEGRNRAEVTRVQFDSYAGNYLDSRRLSNAIRDALVPVADDAPDFYPIALPDGTIIESARIHLDIDNPFEIGEGGYVYRALLDLEMFVIPAN